jgi:hypothetical protein
MSEKNKNNETAKFIETLNKLNEESKRKEEEENKKKIGELTLGELKNLIQSTIRKEAFFGDLPLLNNNQKRELKKWIWISVLILAIGLLGYRTFWFESGYTVVMDKSSLYLEKTKGWTTEKREIKIVDGKWQLRYDLGEHQIYAPIYTPFEARYNNNYKFIFVGRGNLFWVNNEKTSIRPVKLIEDNWSFKSDLTDEWIDFDSLYEYQDYEPVNPRN